MALLTLEEEEEEEESVDEVVGVFGVKGQMKPGKQAMEVWTRLRTRRNTGS